MSKAFNFSFTYFGSNYLYHESRCGGQISISGVGWIFKKKNYNQMKMLMLSIYISNFLNQIDSICWRRQITLWNMNLVEGPEIWLSTIRFTLWDIRHVLLDIKSLYIIILTNWFWIWCHQLFLAGSGSKKNNILTPLFIFIFSSQSNQSPTYTKGKVILESKNHCIFIWKCTEHDWLL